MGKKEGWLYTILAILSLTLLLTVVNFLQSKQYFALLWMCYIGLALIIIGIVKKYPNLILSQIIILLIPDTIWVVSFVITLINTKIQIGIPPYFFNLYPFIQGILSLLHIYTIPLALVALAIMKTKKSYRALLISFVEVIVLFPLMMLIPGNNGVNCLPTPINCVSIPLPNFIPYPVALLISVFIFVIISYFIITSLPFVKEKKKLINNS